MAASNASISDRELLYIIRDVANEYGIATGEDIADRLGVADNGTSPTARITPRLSWMARFGFVQSVTPQELGLKAREGKRWLITDIGRELMEGRLSAALQKTIRDARPGQELLMLRELTRSGYVDARVEVATAMRREWLHNVAQRPR
jgi:hypothetical protein